MQEKPADPQTSSLPAQTNEQLSELKQKCEDYAKVYQNLRNLGFPISKLDDNIINQLKQKNEKEKLIKYFGEHYCGSHSDFTTKLKEHLKQLDIELSVSDEVTLKKPTITFECDASLIGQKYNYEELFRIKQSPCPIKLLSYDHKVTEAAYKLIDQSKQTEMIHLKKIQAHIIALYEKLEKIVKFSKKLEGTIKDEKKLIKEFTDLEIKYQTEKNQAFDFDVEDDQNKKKNSTKKVIENQDEANKEKVEKKVTRPKQKESQQQQNQQQKEKKQKKQEKSEIKNAQQLNQEDLNDQEEQFVEKKYVEKEVQVQKESKEENINEEQQKEKKKKKKSSKKQKQDEPQEQQTQSAQKPKKQKKEEQTDEKQRKLSEFFKKKNTDSKN